MPVNVLTNAFLSFHYRPRHGTFNLYRIGRGPADFDEAVAAVVLHRDEMPIRLRTDALERATIERQPIQDDLGTGEQLIARHPPTDDLQLDVIATLYDGLPCLTLQLQLTNLGKTPVAVEEFILTSVGAATAGHLHLGTLATPLSFFKNGWQSWSYTGILTPDRNDPRTRLTPFVGQVYRNPVTPLPRGRGRFTSDMFGMLISPDDHLALVVGFLSQADQLGTLSVDCSTEMPGLTLTSQADGVPLRPGASLASEPAYFQFLDLPAVDPLADYMRAVARRMKARVPLPPPPVGWCSWYQYFDRVDEKDVLVNLDAAVRNRAELPLRLIQLDQGYERAIGDWLDRNDRFPHDLGWLAERIRETQHTPGLWLAPYILHPDARIIETHPEWLLRNERGRPVKAGFIWNRFTRTLDATHPGVQDWLRLLAEKAVREWGFSYLKLDFLYAGILPGRRYDPTVTRAQALRQGLEIFRKALGNDGYLLACGCPLGPAIGVVDAMRIGPDVDPYWAPHQYGTSFLVGREFGLPGTRNAVRNSLVRSTMHGRWWLNDPDCLLVRSHDTHLTVDEVRSLATVIGLSGGAVILSDDLTRLSPERRAIAAALLPPLADNLEPARPLDLLENEMPELYERWFQRPWEAWHVVGLFNWGKRAAPRSLHLSTLGLPTDVPYHIYEFWTGIYRQVDNGIISIPSIPRHGCVLLSIRPIQSQPHLVATSFHISQGGEINGWQVGDDKVQFSVELGRRATGQVLLRLPASPVLASAEGRPLAKRALADNVWAFDLTVDGTAHVEVGW
ncbi:MAG TPA: alpha-galactosidase [Anaerolineae bacterium]|nr:alpha-galactosidase [Anaerolineae bacterium]HIQ05586.1 alpha-galactosidase [Anaerolineae bacterium]